MVDSANIVQISSSCIQLLSVLSAEPLRSTSVLILFNKRYYIHISPDEQVVIWSQFKIQFPSLVSWIELCCICWCFVPIFSRDMPCIMSLTEIKSLFRMDDIIASAPQPITTLEASARSGQGLQEVLGWLESVTVKWRVLEILLRRSSENSEKPSRHFTSRFPVYSNDSDFRWFDATFNAGQRKRKWAANLLRSEI